MVRAMVAFLGVACGIICGPFLAYIAARPVVRRIAGTARCPAAVSRASVVAGAIGTPLALFVAFVGGGNLGGGWLAGLFRHSGIQFVGVSLGLALGIGLVLACGIWVSAVVGAFLRSRDAT